MPKEPLSICAVTGSRADYGLLYWLLRGLRDDPAFELQLAITGMHLASEFGLTKTAIEQDGFNISATVDSLLASDTPVGISKSIGIGVIGFADAFARLKPDIAIVLGDRYEILAAATAAYIARIPLAHIGGGDTTEGAFDEGIRHSISKMSHLHFVAHEQARRRLLQLGEDPDRIYVVGHPGIEQIRRLHLFSRVEIETRLQLKLRERNLLITFHPVTLDARSSTDQFAELLQVLAQLGPRFGLIFTRPNADTEGRALLGMLDDFVSAHDNAAGFASLGQHLYLSVAAQADAVVGNSSSGIFEIPALKRPTVNIGTRQKGRPLAASVINCEPAAAAIDAAIRRALQTDCSQVANPFGDGQTSGRIIAALKSLTAPRDLLSKRFFELGEAR